MSNAVQNVVAVITLIVSVAIVAVIVSRNADTANVIRAAGDALAGSIKAATSPVEARGGGSFAGSVTA